MFLHLFPLQCVKVQSVEDEEEYSSDDDDGSSRDSTPEYDDIPPSW